MLFCIFCRFRSREPNSSDLLLSNSNEENKRNNPNLDKTEDFDASKRTCHLSPEEDEAE
jgi:hypothetical protein